MRGAARRISAWERTKLLDLDAYVRGAAARLGLDPEAAVAEGRRALADLDRFGRERATQRWAAELGLTVPDYRAKAVAVMRELRTNDGRTG